MQNGLDFSSSIFGQLVGEENCHAGRLDGLTCEYDCLHCVTVLKEMADITPTAGRGADRQTDMGQ